MIQLLILANVLVFVGEVFSADALLSVFALWPPPCQQTIREGSLCHGN